MGSRRRTTEYSNLDQGEIGELLLDSILDDLGFELFTDWEKPVNAPGIDRIGRSSINLLLPMVPMITLYACK